MGAGPLEATFSTRLVGGGCLGSRGWWGGALWGRGSCGWWGGAPVGEGRAAVRLRPLSSAVLGGKSICALKPRRGGGTGLWLQGVWSEGPRVRPPHEAPCEHVTLD